MYCNTNKNPAVAEAVSVTGLKSPFSIALIGPMEFNIKTCNYSISITSLQVRTFTKKLLQLQLLQKHLEVTPDNLHQASFFDPPEVPTASTL
jgi:hypothetical protein